MCLDKVLKELARSYQEEGGRPVLPPRTRPELVSLFYRLLEDDIAFHLYLGRETWHAIDVYSDCEPVDERTFRSLILRQPNEVEDWRLGAIMVQPQLIMWLRECDENRQHGGLLVRRQRKREG